MKKLSFLLCVLCLGTTLSAQQLTEIRLNKPDLTRGSHIMKALNDRHSVREFSSKPLSLQDKSDLLWAANGVNRADGKRTAPSAMDRRDIDVYLFDDRGVYLYDADKQLLKPVAEGDHRGAVAGRQASVKEAPVLLLFVSDLSRFGGNSEQARLTGALDAGIVSQNVALFCAGVGLATVPRGTMDVEALKKLLKLTDQQLPLLNNPVGYPK